MFSTSPLNWLGIVALAVLCLWVGMRLMALRTAWRVSRSRRLGARGEARAIKLLKKAGYTIVADQVPGDAQVEVDGALHTFKLRADYMVTRRGRRYVVEVKGGATAASLSTAATRRQILEYATSYDCDGVLLVDAARGAVHTITFPDL